MGFWLAQILNAAAFGSLLFLLASGFSLIFGLMRITNLTHGCYYLAGGYIGLSMVVFTRSFTLAAIVAGLAVAAFGVFMERIFLRRFHGDPLSQVLLTLGFLFFLDDLMLVVWGGIPQSIPAPAVLSGTVKVFGLGFPRYRLFLIGAGITVAILLWLLIERTRIGATIRAGVDDEETARAMGINVDSTFILVYALGAFLAGLSGVLGGPYLGMEPGMSTLMLPLALVTVIVGGLGSLKGAAVGSLLVAFVDNIGRTLFPDLSYFTLFLPMALVLVFRPQGLFGRPMRG